MRSVLLGLGLCLVLGFIAWNFLSEDADELSVERGEVVAHDELDAAAPRRDQASPVEDGEGLTSSPAESEGEGESDDEEARFRLVCVDAETGAPIADAEVFTLSAELARLPSGGPAPARRYVEEGRSHRSDANGHVSVEATDWLHFHARAGRRVAFGRVWTLARDEQIVELAESRCFRVRVVDHLGETRSGVPVQLAYLGLRTPAYTRPLFEALTDDQGEVLIELDQVQRRGSFTQTLVRVEGLFPPGHEVTVDLVNPPDEAVLIELPAFGEVEVVCDPDEIRPGAVCQLSSSGLGVLSEDLTEGRALFRQVALGLQIGASLHLSESQAGHAGAPVQAGPTQSGERIPLRIDTSEVKDAPELRFRIVDEQGLALARQSFEVQSAGWRERLETDEKGRYQGILTQRLRSSFQGHRARLLVDFGPGRTRLRADLNGTRLQEGTNDLGTIVAQALPLVVAGRLVDDEDQPISHQRLHLRPIGAKGQSGSFPEEDILDCETDAAGYFAAHAIHEAQEIEITVFSTSDQLRVPVGSTDVVLRTSRLARLHLQVRPEPGAGLGSVVIDAVPLSRDPKQFRRSLQPDEKGVFDNVLQAGTWQLRLCRSRMGDDLVIHDFGTQVLVGDQTLDLGEIRVPQQGLECAVEVRGPFGFELPSMRWLLKDPRTKETLHLGYTLQLDDGVLRFNVVSLPVILAFESDELLQKEFEISEVEAVVQLSLGATRHFKLEGVAGLPGGLLIDIKLTRPGSEDISGTFVIGEREEIALSCPSIGVYRIWIGVGGRMADHRLGRNELGYVPTETPAGRGGKSDITIKLRAGFLDCVGRYPR